LQVKNSVYKHYFCALKTSKEVENIFPIFEKTLGNNQKQAMLQQRSVVVWMVGLSGSGKSTLATGLENKLHELGYLTMLLDGDNLRVGINSNLGFSEADRTENIRRAAEVSKLFADCGVVTICSLISPTREIRTLAASILGKKYLEVYVNAPLEACEQRDVKGLYAKARRGEIKQFTGIDAPFEAPESPDIEVHTHLHSPEECLEQILHKLLPIIEY
jgi:adenylylsulfate kinase